MEPIANLEANLSPEGLSDTKGEILNAAAEVFAEFGLSGSRIEMIANRAKTNKAMIYYYYENKDYLYQSVLESVMETVVEAVNQKLNSLKHPVEISMDIFERNFEIYSRNPTVLRILAREVTDGGAILRKIDKNRPELIRPTIEKAASFLEKGIEEGIFRKMEPRKVIISMLGIVILYFVARPFIGILVDPKAKEDLSFEGYKRHFMDMIIRLIVPNGSLE